MIQVTGQNESKAFSGRLRQRLSELGIAVVSIGPDGTGELIGPRRWEHEMIVRSALFTAAVRSRMTDLNDTTGRLITLWPGLGLVPLHSDAKAPDAPHGMSSVIAALLLSTEVLASEATCPYL